MNRSLRVRVGRPPVPLRRFAGVQDHGRNRIAEALGIGVLGYAAALSSALAADSPLADTHGFQTRFFGMQSAETMSVGG
jgi:hypothetical protein